MSKEQLEEAAHSASCDKCGGTDIYRRHHWQGDKWDKMMGDYRRLETVHVSYDTYSCEARRECLTHHCRTCGYEWTTDVYKPNAKVMAPGSAVPDSDIKTDSAADPGCPSTSC